MALWKVLNGMWVPIRQYASDEVPSEVLTKYLYQIDYRTKLVLYYYIYSFNIYTVHKAILDDYMPSFSYFFTFRLSLS